jgi:uncharacterized protein YbjT (DUF2867 family)/predicted ester cyclase
MDKKSTMEKPRVAVTGATGTTGKQLIDVLLARGMDVRAIVRDGAKAGQFKGAGVSVAIADLTDLKATSAFEAALKDCSALYICHPISDNVAKPVEALLKAAKSQGVKHVCRISVSGTSATSPIEGGRQHFFADEAVKAGGIPWTILQPNFFMDNLFKFSLDSIKSGSVYGSAADGKVSYIDSRDIADVAAVVFAEGPSKHGGKSYVLTGAEALTEVEVYKMVSEATGKEVKYINITPEQQKETVTKMGLPPFLIETVCGLDGIKRSGVASGIAPTVKEITGKEPRRYRAYIQENAAKLGGTSMASGSNDPKQLLSTLLRRAEDIDRQSNEAIGLLKGLIAGAPAHDDSKARDSVVSFYRDCLTVNKMTADPVAAMKRITSTDLACRGSTGSLDQNTWAGQVGYFWKLIPDLKAEIQDMIHEGNRYIVRTWITGSPKGDFFGTPCDGTKAFKVMAIDIHTVEHDLIKEIYHVEDWATAHKQLSGK